MQRSTHLGLRPPDCDFGTRCRHLSRVLPQKCPSPSGSKISVHGLGMAVQWVSWTVDGELYSSAWETVLLGGCTGSSSVIWWCSVRQNRRRRSAGCGGGFASARTPALPVTAATPPAAGCYRCFRAAPARVFGGPAPRDDGALPARCYAVVPARGFAVVPAGPRVRVPRLPACCGLLPLLPRGSRARFWRASAPG